MHTCTEQLREKGGLLVKFTNSVVAVTKTSVVKENIWQQWGHSQLLKQLMLAQDVWASQLLLLLSLTNFDVQKKKV